jgi:carbonic anhydrase
MESYKKLLLGNQLWVKEKTLHNSTYFEKLAQDQKPDFLWISCSDSRVPAEEITGAKPGQLFVHRNIANIVYADDINLQSILQYAIEFLKVNQVIVCGHYGCGGVKGSLTGSSMQVLNSWLAPIIAVKDKHIAEIEQLSTEEEKVNCLVRLNVEHQVNTLVNLPIIQKSWKERKLPIVHGWIYNLKTGAIEPLLQRVPK